MVTPVEPRQLFFAFPGVSNRGEQNLVSLPEVKQLLSKALTMPW